MSPSNSRDLDATEIEYLHGIVDFARSGKTEQLAEMIDAGIPVNLTNERGDPLLTLAAYHRHADTVEMLLRRGADHGRVNDRGQTALGAAVFRQDERIVRALLAAGADPSAGERSASDLVEFFDLDEMRAVLAAATPKRTTAGSGSQIADLEPAGRETGRTVTA